jgi:flagellar hook protein FlgE
MLKSLYTGVSGMRANGLSLSVIGDNIANLNTIGFKRSRTAFSDILSQSITGLAGNSSIGNGVMLNDISPLFTQGSMQYTGSALDLAIDGNGFFIVNNKGANYYTRDGQFSMDKDGYIVNIEGLRLQGYPSDSSGNILGTISDIQIDTTTTEPGKLTGKVELALNLNSKDSIPADAWSLDGNGDGVADDPEGYNFSTTATVYDSQGGAHNVTCYYRKTADNTWAAHYVYDDIANPGELIEATGSPQTLTFNQNGALINDNSGTIIQFNFGPSVSSPQNVIFDHGKGTAESGTGLDGTTQFASKSAVANITQDGYGAGTLNNLSISEDGIISGVFTNGRSRKLAQIALAKFQAPAELIKVGGNLLAESDTSGQPAVGTPSAGGIGQVLSNTLELSNVDLAEEFVNMISAQRGFQANSKIVTTTDELLQEILALKR